MPDSGYYIVPANTLIAAKSYASPHEAAVAASGMVQKDKLARCVVSLTSQVQLSSPRIEIVQIEEVPGGQ